MGPLTLGLLAGFGLPLQTAINSSLGKKISSSFLASLISFTIGTIFLGLFVAFTAPHLALSWQFISHQPWWLWLGGFLGVCYLTANIILFPHLGSVQTVLMPVLGQIIMSMLIDNFGWFHSQQHSLSWLRLFGALIVIGGVYFAIAGSQTTSKSPVTSERGLNFWRLIGLVAGMLSATQTAINGHLGTLLHSSVQAALVSFAVGTVFLWLLVPLIEHGYHFNRVQPSQIRWWSWLGGLIGGCYVLTNAYLVPQLGTGLTIVVVLVGMISGSLLLDNFGWLAAVQKKVTFRQILGVILLLSGVVLIKLVG